MNFAAITIVCTCLLFVLGIAMLASAIRNAQPSKEENEDAEE